MSNSEAELRLVIVSEKGVVVAMGEAEAIFDHINSLPAGSEWRLQMRTRVLPEWGTWLTQDGGVT